MHPLGLYVAITDRRQGAGRPTYAAVDAEPLPEPDPAPASRLARLAALVAIARRTILRTAQG